jgi:hypothetical protein
LNQYPFHYFIWMFPADYYHSSPGRSIWSWLSFLLKSFTWKSIYITRHLCVQMRCGLKSSTSTT